MDYGQLNLGVNTFDSNEILTAKEILNSACRLFGHFTIRLMMGGMVDYYQTVNGFSIKILNRPTLDTLQDNLRKSGMLGIESNYADTFGLLRSNYLKFDHIFELFFLNSRIEFKTTNKEIETYSLPFGPIGGVNSIFKAPSIETLARIMSKSFSNIYGNYYNAYLDFTDPNNLLSEFETSATQLFTFVKNKIETKVELLSGQFGTLAELKDFKDNLVRVAKHDIFYLRTKIGSALPTIRSEIETFSRTDVYEHSIVFSGIINPATGREFEISITQDDLVSIGYQIFGNIELKDSSAIDSRGGYRRLTIQEIYQAKLGTKKLTKDKTIDLLQLIMNTYGTIGGEEFGKVRIFPMIYVKGFGYQYMVPDKNSVGDVFAHALRNRPWMPKDPPYFDIDLSTNEGREQLDHIVNILLGNNFLFVIKDRNGDFFDNNMIAAFNDNGFVAGDSILSISGHYGMERISTYSLPAIVNTPLGLDISFLNSQWFKIWNGLPPWYQGDFNAYVTDYLNP